MNPATTLPSLISPALAEAESLDVVAAFLLDQKAARDRAELGLLEAAVAWASLHEPASVVPQICGDQGLQLGGPGIEPVSEYCPDEFAALMGISTDSGRSLIGEALELALRLPKTWKRIQASELSSWRGRIVARATMRLCPAGALEVDRQIAWCAERVGPTQLARIVEAAAIRFEDGYTPDEPTDDPRHVRIRSSEHDRNGHAWLDACLDVADGIDLENALRRRAAHARQLGSDASLDVRRAWALGDIARQDLALDLVATEDADGEPREVPIVTQAMAPVALSVHVMASELEAHAAGDDEDPLYARIEKTRRLITLDALRAWIQRTDARVSVRPVIDTDATLHVNRYEVPDRIRQQVEETSPECVFPWCSRPSHRADLDHIQPYSSGGSTSTENLTPLCRHHHRAKTHAGWSYTQIEPAVFLWRAPGGARWLRDSSGTRRT